MRNKILQISRQTIPYVRELRALAKSVSGCLLMQQLDFHFARYPHGFYKFLAPCPNSKFYKQGQSWQEELGFSAEEFRTAFDKLGVRFQSKSAFDASPDKFQQKLYCSYVDKQQGLTWYFRNHGVVDAALDQLIQGGEPPPAESEELAEGRNIPSLGDEEFRSTVNGQPQSTVDRHSQSTVSGESPSTVDGQSQSPVDGESGSVETGNPDLYRSATPISRDRQSPSLEMGNPDLQSLYSKENNKEKDKENTHTERARGREARRAGVGVGSKYSPEVCRRFADHLHRRGEGINNPGGYATFIFRTGEADSQIEKFLHPEKETKPPDTKGCPDCQGTGFWYPEGYQKGAAKCRHQGVTPGRGDEAVGH